MIPVHLGNDIWAYEQACPLDLVDRAVELFDSVDRKDNGWRYTPEGTKGSMVLIGEHAKTDPKWS